MTDVNRIRVSLTGSGVTGPGVATHYVLGTMTGSEQTAIKDFWTELAGQMPIGVSITVPTEGEIIDDNTGDVTGLWSAGSGGTIVGAGATGYAQGVGARIVWQTNGVTGNRRVRGSTYVVPLLSSAWEADGTMRSVVVTALEGAASSLRADLPDRLVILTRVTTTHSGTSHAVTGSNVPDTPSWLRSRRT